MVDGGVALLMSHLIQAAQRGRPDVNPVSGQAVFRQIPHLRKFALFIAIGVPIAITALVFVKPPVKPNDFWAILSLYGFFIVLGVGLLWDSIRFSLELGEEGLDCRSAWRCRQVVEWSDVSVVSFNSLMGWFVVRDVYGRKIRFSLLVSGIEILLDACEQRLSPDKFERAKAGYAMLKRTMPEYEDRK